MSSGALLIGGGGRSPAVFNDEFDQGNRGWHLIAQIGTLYTPGADPDFGVTTAGKLHVPTSRGVIRPRVPPTPFTVDAFFSYVAFDDVDTKYSNVSLGVAEATNIDTTGPKFYGLHGRDVAFLGQVGVIDGLWTDYSTLSAQNSYVDLGLSYEAPHYQRLVVHSATNIDTYHKVNEGDSWTLYHSGYNPGLASVACVILFNGASTMEVDWVRFS